MTPENLVKSKERVTAHGEVFTAAREVNAMLDLVQAETEKPKSRFLEPACGTGNFLVEVLRRKLAVVNRDCAGKRQSVWELNALVAVSSLYGVDILADNVAECRARLLDVFTQTYAANFGDSIKPVCVRVVAFVLDCNIVWGDALTMARPDSQADIRFVEWSFLPGARVKRRYYTLSGLLDQRRQMAFFEKPLPEPKAVPYLALGPENTLLPDADPDATPATSPAPGL